MHILILTTVFPPEVRSASQIMFELAETLKNSGHKVTVITSIHDSEDKRNWIENFFMRENKNGINVIQISTLPIHKSKAPAVVRGMGQILNAIGYFFAGFFLKKVDISFSYSPPMGLGITGYLLKLTRKIPHVFNVQDLVPKYAIDLGILTNKTLIRLIKLLEHFLYKNVQIIAVHSKGNKDYMLGEGVPPEKVHVIPNWVDTNLVKPADKDNDFRKRNGLEGNFVVLFAGILGFAQDLDTVVECASYLKRYEKIVLLIVGEGVEKDRLMKKAKNLDAKNVRFHPFVSKEKYPEVVAASDACLATLQRNLLCPVIPSKILGYMSAGRPVITSLPLDGDAPYVIQNAESGICVEPGNPEKLADAIVEMYENQGKADSWGKNGRHYILKYHDRDRCIGKYETLFKQLIKTCS